MRTRPPADPPLPRGRHAAPREVVWESQRGRLLAAMAEVVASKGYGAVAVAGRDRPRRRLAQDLLRALRQQGGVLPRRLRRRRRVDARRDRRRDRRRRARRARSRSRAPGPRATWRRSPRTRRSPGRSSSRSRPPGRPRWSDGRARTSGSPRSSRRSARAAGRPAGAPGWAFRACVGAINELVTDHVMAPRPRNPPRPPRAARRDREPHCSPSAPDATAGSARTLRPDPPS